MYPTVQEGDKILITSPTLLKELINYIRWKKPSKKNIVLAESGKSGKDRLKCVDLGFYGLKCFLPITIIVFKPVFKSKRGQKVKKLHYIFTRFGQNNVFLGRLLSFWPNCSCHLKVGIQADFGQCHEEFIGQYWFKR